MQVFIQSIMTWYFGILDQFGLLGVVALMAMESSIFPVPSEMVIPPAAVVYLHDAHRDGAVILTIVVILAGTIGSYIGASTTYWVARALGRPFIVKYGKYFLITEKKLKEADQWMVRYGAGGIFLARLLPVVRHIISIPAGIIGMRFRTFSTMTILGSLLWCTVLAIFGLVMADEMQLIVANHGQFASPAEAAMVHAAVNKLTLATLGLVGVVMACYIILVRVKGRPKRQADSQHPSTDCELL
ncbi:MAG TPA: DedA family protein [Armatimonadota bacterium]|nr:DedA family protein [Armatimonadota bacterium]